jgi:hypothetical protein
MMVKRSFATQRTKCCDTPMDNLPPLPTEPTPGLYRHYKGNDYRVIGLARHSETLEPMVVYEALYGTGGLWVRPSAMFTETVELDGKPIPRFVRVGD